MCTNMKRISLKVFVYFLTLQWKETNKLELNFNMTKNISINVDAKIHYLEELLKE